MEKAHPIFRSASIKKPKEVPLKKNIRHYIGIDIAADTFTASVFQNPSVPAMTTEPFGNSPEGFNMLHSWLVKQNVSSADSIICMEATGVYGEALTHYLSAQGFSVAVEPPLKVKRSFDAAGHKSDAADSAQIAEYAYRFFDELRFWKSRPEHLEKIKHFLTAREQLVKESVAIQNALCAYRRHPVQDESLKALHERHSAQLKELIADIDARIKELIYQEPSLHQLSLFLTSLCGVGILLSAYLLVMTNAFQDIANYKIFAAFLGICPYKHESGSSINHPARCRNFGPDYAKKLLHLAARSVATHHPEFKKYYLRKIEEGKNKTLVLNNISNKLIKICFALVHNKQYYIKGYRSINPLVLQSA